MRKCVFQRPEFDNIMLHQKHITHIFFHLHIFNMSSSLYFAICALQKSVLSFLQQFKKHKKSDDASKITPIFKVSVETDISIKGSLFLHVYYPYSLKNKIS